MTAYYNEIDPHAARWLRNLIAGGHIAAGDVDERSIADVCPDDLRGYAQAHFFAGIGGWSLALRLAGWPDDRSVWTGSCPCQRISGLGSKDDDWREWHWWRRLIQKSRPSIVFGEQVAGGLGPQWLARVLAELEDDQFAVGAANLRACGVGAPHQRERSLFVAVGDPESIGRREGISIIESAPRQAPAGQSPWTGESVLGRDGLRRRLKPGVELLVNGLSGRVADLRGFGNAIVPQMVAKFIAAADGSLIHH